MLGDDPLSDTKTSLGLATVVLLAVLRIGIGWHFFMEGAKKIQDPEFSSAAFLRNAKGPLAPLYHGSIPDADGYERLDYGLTYDRWNDYVGRAASYYNLDEAQVARAYRAFDARAQELADFLTEKADDIAEFRNQYDKLQIDRYEQTELGDIPFQQKRWEDKEKELRAKLNGWLAETKKIAQGLESDVQSVATAEQRAVGKFRIPDPGQGLVDTVIPWLNLIVGLLLLLGLCTPVAALAGSLFLLSVIGTQPPWVPGADPIYYQVVEFLALVTVGVSLAGRFGGLDYFLIPLCNRICPCGEEPTHES